MCQNTHVYESSLYMYLLLVHWNVSREKGPNYTCSFNEMPPNDVCLIMYLGGYNKMFYKQTSVQTPMLILNLRVVYTLQSSSICWLRKCWPLQNG